MLKTSSSVNRQPESIPLCSAFFWSTHEFLPLPKEIEKFPWKCPWHNRRKTGKFTYTSTVTTQPTNGLKKKSREIGKYLKTNENKKHKHAVPKLMWCNEVYAQRNV